MTGPDPDDSRKMLETGAVIGSAYQILGVLRQAPHSTVYRALHRMLQKEVAIKVLSFVDSAEEARSLLRFQKEAKIACSLDHPNIIKTFAAAHLENGCPYIVMELAERDSLQELLHKDCALSLSQFKEIFHQVLEGLEYAHESGLIHRDIKPENILMASSPDGTLLVKLADFGIAKVRGQAGETQSLTATGDVLGTPAYMSPEQCRNAPLDERSDIYSIGCVMYEALSLRPVFEAGSSLDFMYKQVNERPAPLLQANRELPPSYARLVERCLEKDPAKRFQTAAELKKGLQGLNPAGRGRKGKAGFLLAAVAAMFLLLLVCYWIRSNRAAPHSVVARETRNAPLHRIGKKLIDDDCQDDFERFSRALSQSNYAAALQTLERMKANPKQKEQSHVMTCFAYYYKSLHDYEQTLKCAREAEALALQENKQLNYKPAHRFPYTTARLAEALALTAMKQLKQSEQILKEEEARLRENLGLQDAARLLCECYLDQFEVLRGQRKFGEAELFCKKILGMQIVGMQEQEEFKGRFLVCLMQALALQGKAYALEVSRKDFERFLRVSGIERKSPRGDFKVLESVALVFADDWEAVRRIYADPAVCSNDLTKVPALVLVQRLLVRGLSEIAFSEWTAAESTYTDILRLQRQYNDRGTVVSNLNLAYVLSRSGRSEQAELLLNRALKLPESYWVCSPPEIQSAEAELYLADVLLKDGKVQGARRILQLAQGLPQLDDAEQKRIDARLSESKQN